MEEIGSLLKQRRQELGLSFEDVSYRTKLSTPYLKAIEAGNVSFFKNDLSYLTYFIRYYATELGLNYDDFRDQVDVAINDYLRTVNETSALKRAEISESIRKESKQGHNDKKSVTTRKKPRRKIDFSMIGFLGATIAVVLLLAYVGINYLPKLFANDPVDKPIVNIPDDSKDPDDKEEPNEPTPPVKNELKVTAIDATNFTIENWNAETAVNFDLKFVSPKTWIAVNVNGKQLDIPKSKIYDQGEEVRLSEKGGSEKVVMFHLGKVLGNELYIDGVRVELDNSIAQSGGVVKLYFKFVGNGGQ